MNQERRLRDVNLIDQRCDTVGIPSGDTLEFEINSYRTCVEEGEISDFWAGEPVASPYDADSQWSSSARPMSCDDTCACIDAGELEIVGTVEWCDVNGDDPAAPDASTPATPVEGTYTASRYRDYVFPSRVIRWCSRRRRAWAAA